MYVQASMELGPEDVSLLERCPHFSAMKIYRLTSNMIYIGKYRSIFICAILCVLEGRKYIGCRQCWWTVGVRWWWTRVWVRTLHALPDIAIMLTQSLQCNLRTCIYMYTYTYMYMYLWITKCAERTKQMVHSCFRPSSSSAISTCTYA